MREKIVIKQYKAHPNIEGINVLDKENRLPRPDAIERMAEAFNSVVSIISPEACVEGCTAALDALLGGKNEI